jgi:hypothetical protein
MFLLAMGTSVAMAQTSGVHFTHGGEPTCTITFSSTTSAFATCDAEVAGLGQELVNIVATLSGTAVYQCQNKGGNLAPGQNQVLVGPAVGNAQVTPNNGTNGRTPLEATTPSLTPPTTVSGQAAGCPNGNWTGINPTLTASGITFTASQGTQTIFSCTRSLALTTTSTITFNVDTECTGVATE